MISSGALRRSSSMEISVAKKLSTGVCDASRPVTTVFRTAGAESRRAPRRRRPTPRRGRRRGPRRSTPSPGGASRRRPRR
eukprot:11701733-Heterocapsa_arctica.AAC.1